MTLPLDLPEAPPVPQPRKQAPMDGIGAWRELASNARRKQCDACLQVVHETWPNPPIRVMAAKYVRALGDAQSLLCSKHALPLKEIDDEAREKAKAKRKRGKKR